MYESLGLKILGWRSFSSMSVRRTWQLKDYGHDVVGMLEQGTPWFERGNKLSIMLTNNLPLCPFCSEQKL